MPMEAGRDGARRRRHRHAGLLGSRPDFWSGRKISAHPRRLVMTPLASLQPICADLTERFGTRLKPLTSAQPNEVYFEAQMDLVPGFCAQLYKKWDARLVGPFADDARTEAGVFHLY